MMNLFVKTVRKAKTVRNVMRRAPIIERLRAGDTQAFEEIMRTHNQRLFRIARGIVRNAHDAEDVVQEAYIQAFTKIESFQGTGDIGAWLARITANQALSKLRQKTRTGKVIKAMSDENGGGMMAPGEGGVDTSPSPEKMAALSQIRDLIEFEVDRLPDGFREVFVMRAVEEMSVAETAEALDIPEQTVKSRLHRARAMMQKSLKSQLSVAALKAFPFGGQRCNRIVASVQKRLHDQGVLSAQ